jgi:predicted flap endonuclease-1-like 5' DNA nuclease
MAYKIEEIEGVGAAYGEKLNAVGIKTTDDLLEKGATKKGRTSLAESTGISEKLILKWTNHADLFRIKGVAGQFAELLEAAGVDTVKEFRNRVAANLHAKMVEINEAKNLTNRIPSVDQLAEMVEFAKTLEAKMTY